MQKHPEPVLSRQMIWLLALQDLPTAACIVAKVVFIAVLRKLIGQHVRDISERRKERSRKKNILVDK